MSAGQVFQFTVTMESSGPCPTCGVDVCMPSNLLSALRNDKRLFYCVNGHSQSFKESETDRLKKQLEAARANENRERELRMAARKRADDAELSARLTRGKLNALKKRTKNGVCPCCHRSFVQLQRHMATKHPDYAQESQE